MRTAEKLLGEIKPQTAGGHVQLRILESYCLLATKQKANIEKALGILAEITNNEVSELPLIVSIRVAAGNYSPSECQALVDTPSIKLPIQDAANHYYFSLKRG